MRTHTFLATAALALTVALLPSSSATSALGGDLDGQGTDTCTPLTQTGVSFLNPDGTTSIVATPGAAVRTTYTTKQGSTIVSIAPPDGFDPSQADATTLQTFGIPARPTDPQVLRDWLAVWGQPLKADHSPGRMCQHQKSNPTSRSNN
jgi:hypothetical protein